ncbi:alpha/beta fold hydrolase [Streptomyces sp. NRRL S-481]|uniref:alpha/beta fold hydrolase n=1 Tax=Streptomyces sp. NRRL S-481 TaxID=1463911 RepID=UPI001F29783B|nr:alpha/beta fold hydrolase [Streptomyces sp. NRRL S-481]
MAAAGHTVVCPDLRGYGGSDKPPTDPEHRPYSKRAMAGDCVAVMRRLGHERFADVGHDRGAYVATRQRRYRRLVQGHPRGDGCPGVRGLPGGPRHRPGARRRPRSQQPQPHNHPQHPSSQTTPHTNSPPPPQRHMPTWAGRLNRG